MEHSPVRILLVEDFEPFRKLIHRLLEPNPGLQIVAEAADGQEAVHQAAEFLGIELFGIIQNKIVSCCSPA